MNILVANRGEIAVRIIRASMSSAAGRGVCPDDPVQQRLFDALVRVAGETA